MCLVVENTLLISVQLFACEAGSLTLREEHGLSVFENRVLRKMFVSKTDDVKMELRRLNKEELHALYP